MTNEAVDWERYRILWECDRAQANVRAYLTFLGLLFCNATVYPSLEFFQSIRPDSWLQVVPLSILQGTGVSLFSSQIAFVITIGALHGAPLRFRLPCSIFANFLICISAFIGASLSPSQEGSVIDWTEAMMLAVCMPILHTIAFTGVLVNRFWLGQLHFIGSHPPKAVSENLPKRSEQTSIRYIFIAFTIFAVVLAVLSQSNIFPNLERVFFDPNRLKEMLAGAALYFFFGLVASLIAHWVLGYSKWSQNWRSRDGLFVRVLTVLSAIALGVLVLIEVLPRGRSIKMLFYAAILTAILTVVLGYVLLLLVTRRLGYRLILVRKLSQRIGSRDSMISYPTAYKAIPIDEESP